MIEQAQRLRSRIAQVETEMMEFRASMAIVLAELYRTVHELEHNQRWSEKPANLDALKLLRDCILLHFDEGELKTMCFDLGVSYDGLDGETINDKAREFVLYTNRNGRLDEMIKYCKDKRPNAKLMI